MGDDVIRMQQEAAQRVQRMQERARRLVAESPATGSGQRAEQPEKRTANTVEEMRQAQSGRPAPLHTPPPAETAHAEKADKADETGKEGDAPSGLASLVGDQDRLFILLLAILLVRNGAKMELVLALLYLAM